jgi:hypothetical protein
MNLPMLNYEGKIAKAGDTGPLNNVELTRPQCLTSEL